jgi:lysophospholipase L1-like esterase
MKALRNSMSKPRLLLIALLIALQLLLVLSFVPVLTDQAVSGVGVLTIGAMEILLCLILFSILTGKFPTTATTIFLLLLANVLMTPFNQKKASETFITLPPNQDYKIRIVGDVTPGFSGISRITTDDHGFRVTRPVDYKNKGDVYRIFAIGASTTAQMLLSNEKTWTTLLEKDLEKAWGRKVEIINAGVNGLRAEQHFITFENILQYSPDAVIFLMGINDWSKHIRDHFLSEEAAPKQSGSTSGGADKSPGLSARIVILANSFDIRKSLVWLGLTGLRNRLFDVVHVDDGSYYSSQNNSLARKDVREFSTATVSANYQGWVERIINKCAETRTRCVFVNQPNAYSPDISEDLRKRLWMTPAGESYTLKLPDLQRLAKVYNTWLISTAAQQGMQVCDIASAVPPSLDYIYDDCHFNEGGARLVANLIASCLVK